MSQKVVMVTGAGSGIGRAIALAFAERGGAVLLLVGRNSSRLEEVCCDVKKVGGHCAVHVADMGDTEQVRAAFDVARSMGGSLDVLVNNAGQAVCQRVEELDLSAFDAMLRVNAAGVVYACQAAWPLMRAGGGGTIINISSMAAFDPFLGLAAYGATKAFVNLLTQGMAEEGKAASIRVFGVAPGAVETGMLRSLFPDFPQEETLPPSAIADMVVALTDPSCRYCTGQTLTVKR